MSYDVSPKESKFQEDDSKGPCGICQKDICENKKSPDCKCKDKVKFYEVPNIEYIPPKEKSNSDDITDIKDVKDAEHDNLGDFDEPNEFEEGEKVERTESDVKVPVKKSKSDLLVVKLIKISQEELSEDTPSVADPDMLIGQSTELVNVELVEKKNDEPNAEEKLRQNINKIGESGPSRIGCYNKVVTSADHIIKHISDLEMIIQKNESQKKLKPIPSSTIEKDTSTPYFYLCHEYSSNDCTKPKSESKFRVLSIQALPPINVPGPYILQRTVNLYIDPTGKSHNRLKKMKNCGYLELHGTGGEAVSSVNLQTQPSKHKSMECEKIDSVHVHTPKPMTSNESFKSTDTIFDNSIGDIVNRVAEKLAMTNETLMQNIDHDTMLLFQSYQVLKQPAAKTKSQEFEIEAEQRKIVKDIISNITAKLQPNKNAISNIKTSPKPPRSVELKVPEQPHSGQIPETRSPVDMGFYQTKSIQCCVEGSPSIYTDHETDSESSGSTSSSSSDEADSIPVKDRDNVPSRTRSTDNSEPEKDSQVSSKITLDAFRKNEMIQTSFSSSSDEEVSVKSDNKSKKSSKTTSKSSYASSERSFYKSPGHKDEGVENFYKGADPSDPKITHSTSGTKQLQGFKSDEDDDIGDSRTNYSKQNTPTILTVFEKRTMPEGGECLASTSSKSSKSKSNKSLTSTRSPWEKALNLLKPAKKSLPVSNSNAVSLDETFSEGEINCKSTLSLGEIYVGQHYNEIRRKQKIGINHANENYKRQFNEPMTVTRQRTQYNNWVTYYLHKNQTNTQVVNDSSVASSSDMNK